MSKISLKNNICVVAKVSTKFKNYLDYYVLIPKRGYRYAFSKKYKKSCYNLCKSPILLNKILYNRSNDTSLMILKKYFNHNISYLVYYLELDDFFFHNEKKNKYHRAA